jgi:putative endonuclease
MYYVYLVQCSDTTLYAGITTDLKRRVEEHNSDKLGARYTRARQPVTLVYSRRCKDRSAASKAEATLKRLSRVQKLDLIKKGLP